MKMVAASKMKADVARLERAKTFGVGTIQRVIESETYLAKKKANFTAKKWLLVPITTDKGLCGGVNSSVIREVKAMVKADRAAYKLFVVGDKGAVALSRSMADILQYAATHVATPLNFPTGSSRFTQPVPSRTRWSSTPRTAIVLCWSTTSSRTLSVQSRERWRSWTEASSSRTSNSWPSTTLKVWPSTPTSSTTFTSPVSSITPCSTTLPWNRAREWTLWRTHPKTQEKSLPTSPSTTTKRVRPRSLWNSAKLSPEPLLFDWLRATIYYHLDHYNYFISFKVRNI